MGALTTNFRVDVAWRTTALLAATTLLGLGACSPPQDGLVTDRAATEASAVEPEAPTDASAEIRPSADEESVQASQPAATETATDIAADRLSADSSGRSTTLAALATLAVKGRAAKTGYERAQFGPAWLDADRNGCDTRNDVLRRDLTAKTFKVNTNDCVVLTGMRADDYTGTNISHVRGNSQLDIDHRVALSNAWQTGALKWTLEKRAAFANDPFNLTATNAGANRSKGAGDAATWLPPNKNYRCDYVSIQIAVKQKYGLWVTSPERDAIVRVLGDCAGHLLVADSDRAPTEVDHKVKPVAAASTAPQMTSTPPPKQSLDVYYRNCTAARAAGGAPVHRDQPGYGKHLDRDGDGVGCE